MTLRLSFSHARGRRYSFEKLEAVTLRVISMGLPAKYRYPVKFEFQINKFFLYPYVLCNRGAILRVKKTYCLFVIQIKLGILYFHLLLLAHYLSLREELLDWMNLMV